MSWNDAPDPHGPEADAPVPIEILIVPRIRDLGGFEVRRVLPASQKQMVRPFMFFAQMGPVVFSKGQGVDVRPHPHIGLATVTYLYEGSSTPYHLIFRFQQDEKRPDARRVNAGLARANASERNTADGRFSSCPKGAAQIRQCGVAVLGKGRPFPTDCAFP